MANEDKRLKIDGANATRDIWNGELGDWDEDCLQLVWDAIALHRLRTTSIAPHKVVATNSGKSADSTGPACAMDEQLTSDQWIVITS